MSRLCTMTQTMLKEWFVDFNGRYFNDELPMPVFKFTNARTFLGQFAPRYGKAVIKMSLFYDRTEHDLQNTFIHEMIHEWQWVHGYTDSHGDSFKRKAREINRYGWEIQRCSNLNGAKMAEGQTRRTRTTNKMVYLFVWNNGSGEKRWCMAKPSALSACMEEARFFPNSHQDLRVYRLNEQLRGFTANTHDLRYYQFWKYADIVNKAIDNAKEIDPQHLNFI